MRMKKKYPFKMGNEGSQDEELESINVFFCFFKLKRRKWKQPCGIYIFIEVLHAGIELNFLLIALQTLKVFQLFEALLVFPEVQKLFVF